MSTSFLPPERNPHLRLPRVDSERIIRRPPVTVRPPDRNPAEHGQVIREQVEEIVEQAQARPSPPGVRPALVLRVETEGGVQEAQWRSAGFRVVGEEGNRRYLLFADDNDLAGFLEKVEAYEHDLRKLDAKNPPHAWLAWISPGGVARYGPEDRTGPLLRDLIARGGPQSDVLYWLDLDLWDHGDRERNRQALAEVERYLGIPLGGEVTDRFVDRGLVLARIRVRGDGIHALLELEAIYQVDLPPRMAHHVDEVYRTGVDDIPTISAPAPDAPRLCVIDSGVARGHPLLRQAVGETIAFPTTLGDGLDVNGHGTEVAGLAIYGDVESARRRGEFVPRAWLDAARVTNADGGYDDERLIATQMREAVEYFAARGCRLFVLAQGDPRLVYRGGRVSSWAAMLDALAREHNCLIIVSAGNREPDLGTEPYPACLANDDARIIEPATAVNVLTVGAISESGRPQLEQRYPQDVPPRPVARANQPAPFTRRGPGMRGSVKPELVHYGGNYSYEARADRYIQDRGLGVVTLDWQHTQRLFTIDHGTSMSAPRVAYCAAAVAQQFPSASANLWRALLVGSAELPGAVDPPPLPEGLWPYDVCGYGVPREERALWSSDERVTLFAEDEITVGRFHTYAVSIPNEFRDTGGERRLTVTLAFDPPVARRFHSRYTGNRMTFDLLRGMDIEDVIAAYAKPVEDEESEELPDLPDRNRCNLKPSVRRRSAGTVQRGTWGIERNTALNYKEPFWLVVRCLPNWQSDFDTQRYAVVVTLEHMREGVPLYSALQVRVRELVRTRVTE